MPPEAVNNLAKNLSQALKPWDRLVFIGLEEYCPGQKGNSHPKQKF